MPLKRVHFSCDEGVYDKLESLRHLLGVKREEIIEQAILDRFREVIANIAAAEGLLEKSPVVELKRGDFDTSRTPNVFDELCDKLGLKADDGSVASITCIQIEVKNVATVKNDL